MMSTKTSTDNFLLPVIRWRNKMLTKLRWERSENARLSRELKSVRWELVNAQWSEAVFKNKYADVVFQTTVLLSQRNHVEWAWAAALDGTDTY